jgi:hypothetical protein
MEFTRGGIKRPSNNFAPEGRRKAVLAASAAGPLSDRHLAPAARQSPTGTAGDALSNFILIMKQVINKDLGFIIELVNIVCNVNYILLFNHNV